MSQLPELLGAIAAFEGLKIELYYPKTLFKRSSVATLDCIVHNASASNS